MINDGRQDDGDYTDGYCSPIIKLKRLMCMWLSIDNVG